MPAPSKAMQAASAIALYHPEKLHKKNRSMLGMTAEQLRDFAATKHKGLPEHSGKLSDFAKLKRSKRKRR